MAPAPPDKRNKDPKQSTGQRATAFPKDAGFGDEFRTTKKDKRLIKQSSFLAKVEKSYKKTAKRRRPSKKLVTKLDSLLDALPEAGTEKQNPSDQANIIQHQTLKHRRGAMKRKERIEKLERDRFAKNLAQLAAAQPNTTETTSVSNRWAALRGFISQTMDQQASFKESNRNT
ncbi:hypothetical protein VTN31DRAFT_3837 [Thermomyces dupontii]|uniref:uncharacterized protein n=1 Tax=Talaromyces thermophilus TaxID=28565 RepID=UPI00374475CD